MPSIAFIGLGNMGGPMAANLVKAGHKVTGFDLVPASCDAAKAEGVAIAASAVEAVADAEIVVTMLPAGKHVIAVWSEIAPAIRSGQSRSRPKVQAAASVGRRKRPKIVVVMGPDALDTLNELALPLARTVEPEPGRIQPLTPSIDTLYTPNIDEALDEEAAKREFWRALRTLGEWYADFPPY